MQCPVSAAVDEKPLTLKKANRAAKLRSLKTEFPWSVCLILLFTPGMSKTPNLSGDTNSSVHA